VSPLPESLAGVTNGKFFMIDAVIIYAVQNIYCFKILNHHHRFNVRVSMLSMGWTVLPKKCVYGANVLWPDALPDANPTYS